MSPVYAPCGATVARATARASSSWRRNSPARASAGSTSKTTPPRSASGRWRTSPPSWSSATARSSSTVPSSPTTSTSGGCSSRWKNPSDRVLDRRRRGARVRRRTDRPAHDDVIGAVSECLGHVDRALLVAGLGTDGPDARCHDEKSLAEFGFQHRRLVSRSDDAVAARVYGALRAGENQLLQRLRGAHFVEIALVEAGEHRHGEDLHRPLLARCGLHHRAVAVHGEEGCAAAAHVGDRALHGLGNVVEL